MRLSPVVDTLLNLPAPIFSRIHVLSLAPPFFMRLAASRAKLTVRHFRPYLSALAAMEPHKAIMLHRFQGS
jgi:hypothetical protein